MLIRPFCIHFSKNIIDSQNHFNYQFPTYFFDTTLKKVIMLFFVMFPEFSSMY